MRRICIALTLMLTLPVTSTIAAEVSPGQVHDAGVFMSGSSVGAVPLMKGPSIEELRARITTVTGEPQLSWPNKKISLDVKDANIRRIAELLSTQTGISITVKEAVPSGLKITIQAGDMAVKQFLDTLCAATNLTYTAESRAETGKTDSTKSDIQSSEIRKAPGVQVFKPSSGGEPEMTLEAPEIHFNQTGNGYEIVASQGQRVVILNAGTGKPVTHVTISSLAAEGVVVNMGTVSMSVKDADPVEVATKLINKITGASYMVMDLKDYIALQDTDRGTEIEKALRKTSRSKVTLTLRNVPIWDALNKLAEKGHFYITTPQPGQNSFLIIPDVTVVDAKAMPGLSPAAVSINDILIGRDLSHFRLNTEWNKPAK